MSGRLRRSGVVPHTLVEVAAAGSSTEYYEHENKKWNSHHQLQQQQQQQQQQRQQFHHQLQRWISRARHNYSYYASQQRQSSPLRHKSLIFVILLLAFFFLGFVWMILGGMIRKVLRQCCFGTAAAEQARPPESKLDFIVAGFPKSGTTTLLFSLSKHPQILMEDRENCQIARPLQQDDINILRLNRDLYALQKTVTNTKTPNNNNNNNSEQQQQQQQQHFLLGIKCPDALKNFKAIHRLSQHSPDCKFIIGLRHPIWYLQSFYNYRVLETHLKKNHLLAAQDEQDIIPTLHSIFEEKSNNWRDVSPEMTRFELFLGQFGKTSFAAQQLKDMYLDRPMLAIKPSRFPIFLYILDQIEDPLQSQILRRDMQAFLGLQQQQQVPLAPFGHENQVHELVRQQYQESIDICQDQFQDIRNQILQYAQVTVQWMLRDFLASPDVVVSDRPSFVRYVQSWTTDPCFLPSSSTKRGSNNNNNNNIRGGSNP